MPSKLVIFDFDGTLFDTHASIAHSIKLTFDKLLPAGAPSPAEADVQRLIARGAGLAETFRALLQQQQQQRPPSPSNTTTTTDPASTGDEATKPPFDESSLWTQTYRELYATHGQPLVRPFAGAAELLEALSAASAGRGGGGGEGDGNDVVTMTMMMPAVAIVSNKGVGAVVAALDNAGVSPRLVPRDLVVGDTTPGASRKPHPASFVDVLAPTLRDRYGISVDVELAEKSKTATATTTTTTTTTTSATAVEDVGAGRGGGGGGGGNGEVLVVGDTAADILFARNIGARACWCRYGYGVRSECEALRPDYTVDSLQEVLQYV